ncbi:uncharacterized protein TNCV_457361 [Trichonephila clavipes]|nr:uncharacterized protein TNCV_457361 [Trichonephila clavipes]
MSRFGGLSEERPSVFKTRSKLGTHLSTQCSGDERQSRPCAAHDSRPGTPHLTNCEQRKILARNMKFYTITIENIKANIRSLKLHGLTDEDCHIMKEHVQRLDNYTALNELTVVIKGLPKKAKPEDIHNDLIDLGFTVDRVSQLTGKITNQLLPVFLVSLPRNMTNATIFKLDKLSYLNVSVEGYDSKGVTQCYKCQQFNHTASNCHIKPKCLKCGEPHQTTDCKIDKVETMYCVNCEAYGHMSNYSKCPLYPKPRKGASIKPNYTSIVNSLVRPNVSFAQAAAQQERSKITAPIPQQMAPRNGQVPSTMPTQTQAATTHITKQTNTNNAKSECVGLITQTLSQTIQALSLLVQQINSIDFSSNTPQPSSINKHKTQRKKEIRALVEALLDDYDE